MKKILALLIVATGLLAGCAAPTPYAQNCINTTPNMSAARWKCLQAEPKQTYSNNQPSTQQAPAYDPFRAPTIVPMGNNGLTPGNSGMNCTPDGRGGYNCR